MKMNESFYWSEWWIVMLVRLGALGVDLGLDEPTAAELQQVEIDLNANSRTTPTSISRDIVDSDRESPVSVSVSVCGDSAEGDADVSHKPKKMYSAQGMHHLKNEFEINQMLIEVIKLMIKLNLLR